MNKAKQLKNDRAEEVIGTVKLKGTTVIIFSVLPSCVEFYFSRFLCVSLLMTPSHPHSLTHSSAPSPLHTVLLVQLPWLFPLWTQQTRTLTVTLALRNTYTHPTDINTIHHITHERMPPLDFIHLFIFEREICTVCNCHTSWGNGFVGQRNVCRSLSHIFLLKK